MRVATLFSGIGAPEQAARRVYGDDFEIVFACEFDKFARESYLANYNIDEDHFHIDVNDLDATRYRGKVDMLIGGSPCQSFSIAGLRKGTKDERGGLIYEYIRVVDECRPEVIVYENVKGILSIDNGRTIKEFAQALRDIGYHCHYGVVNTKDYGVPQNRERLFLVGFLCSERYFRFNFPEKLPLKKKLADVLEDDVDEKYFLSHKLIKTLFFTASGKDLQFKPAKCANIDSSAAAITARVHKMGRQDNYIEVVGILDTKGNDQIRRVYGTDGIAPAMQTCGGGNREPKIQVRSATRHGHEEACIGDINSSMPTSNTRRGRVGGNVPQALDTQCGQERIRKLTPRECLRLQDFPDDFKIVVSNTQAYKQAGNSMSVNVVEMIFQQIEKTKKPQKNNLLGFCE